MLEVLLVYYQIWPQKVQEHIKILIAQLDRGGSQAKHSFSIVAEEFDRLVVGGFLVSDMVCLIHNHQIEFWRGIKVQ